MILPGRLSPTSLDLVSPRHAKTEFARTSQLLYSRIDPYAISFRLFLPVAVALPLSVASLPTLYAVPNPCRTLVTCSPRRLACVFFFIHLSYLPYTLVVTNIL